MLWLTSGGLIVCLVMVVGLLLLILYQGVTTFWPVPVVRLSTISGESYMGEPTRQNRYLLNWGMLATMSGPVADAAGDLLHPLLRQKVAGLLDSDQLREQVDSLEEPVARAVSLAIELAPQVRDAPARERAELLGLVNSRLQQQRQDLSERFAAAMREAVDADESGKTLAEFWSRARTAEQNWLALADLAQLSEAFASEESLLLDVWANHLLLLLSGDIAVPMRRRLIRTGNFELTNEHFRWVSDFEVQDEDRPPWALVVERLTWGRFYAFPQSLLIDGEVAAQQPDEIWAVFEKHHASVRQRWRQRRELETHDTGRVNRQMEQARLGLRRVELAHGKQSPQWETANETFQAEMARLDEQFTRIRSEIELLDAKNAGFQLIMETADGEQQSLALADIVRAYPANRLKMAERVRIYGSRWWEFLSDEPREANSEGGVFPAIFGTVTMTLLMSLAVVPFGVLAALYLREYARAGIVVSTVRIAVNNLAGVPSIVFGVFGLGFFCYLIGASIDQLFFEARLPSPTFGTQGVLWASLTLALLTLPVVIVATEEALAAVPRSMREGSLACGATKWQTIRRIVLPRAMPGIMTGMILAMARGAGEVAPLMLVGAAKLAPELPVDDVFPFVHLQRSFMHLGFHIFDVGFQSQNSEAAKPMVFTTTLLLIAIIALMNMMAIWLRAVLRKKFEYGQF